MGATLRIFIHVQHLLGTGHLRRMAAIAQALAERGHDVEIASGGPPLSGLQTGAARLFQLPSMRATDSTFRIYIDEHGTPIAEAWKTTRRETLLARFAAFRPDVLITELFPFGRRQLEFELLPLLDAARALSPRPLILSSVRDILVEPQDLAKVDRALERAWIYDRILVHGDPALIDLPASYTGAHILGDRLIYTGYIASPRCPEPPPGDGEDEIIVSTGGGAVGARLLEAAIEAQGLAAGGRRWRLLLGSDLPDDARARLMARGSPSLIIEPARADFPGLLRRCHVSVSQAGYNTAMDILQARARAVLVPFAGGGETEQPLRAAALAMRGWAVTVEERHLNPGTLAQAVAEAGAAAPPDTSLLRCDAAVETALVVETLTADRRGS